MIVNNTKGERPAQKKIGNNIERKTIDVPKSGCFIINATGINTMAQAFKKSSGLLMILSFSSEAKNFERASTVAILANSDGCNPNPAMLNQLFEPDIDFPNTKTNTNKIKEKI